MRRFIVYFLCVCTFSLLGCAKFIKPQKTDITDAFLEDLARDLAEINIMVENAKKEYPKETIAVKVLAPWRKPPVVKAKAASLRRGPIKEKINKKEIFNTIAFSTIMVPMVKGANVANILKIKEQDTEFYAVVNRKKIGVYIEEVASKEIIIDNKVIKIFEPDLAYKPKAVEVIAQYVSITSRIEEEANKILEKLTEIKNKYLNSPIYIEGFTIQFPIISVQIQFKFK